MKLFIAFTLLSTIFFILALSTTSLVWAFNGVICAIFAIVRIREENNKLDVKIAELKAEQAELEKKLSINNDPLEADEKTAVMNFLEKQP